MEEKDSIIELIFNNEKLKRTKNAFGIIITVLSLIVQLSTNLVTTTTFFQLVLILLFLYYLAKFIFYKNKEGKRAIFKDVIGMSSAVIILVLSTLVI